MLAMNMMKLLEQLQQLPIDTLMVETVVRVYMRSGLWDDAATSHVPLHCGTVAKVALTLAEVAELPAEMHPELILAALIHDARKNREIELSRHINDGSVMKAASIGSMYCRAATDQWAWFKAFGPAVSSVIGLAKLAGHATLDSFIREERALVEEVFHLSDDLCGGQWGTQVVMLDRRMTELETRYPWLGSEHPSRFHGKSWICVQREVSMVILDKLASRTVHENGAALNQWLVDTLE